MTKQKCEQWLTDDGLLLLSGWARDGLTDEQIAKNMDISVKTLYNWKKSNLPILHALKRGKEIADREVENALFKRAIGYNLTEEKTEIGVDGNEKITTTTKHVAGDVTAQIFWLKNRKPQEWRDKRTEIIGISDDESDGLFEAIKSALNSGEV